MTKNQFAELLVDMLKGKEVGKIGTSAKVKQWILDNVEPDSAENLLVANVEVKVLNQKDAIEFMELNQNGISAVASDKVSDKVLDTVGEIGIGALIALL